jgi:hypothetical protein
MMATITRRTEMPASRKLALLIEFTAPRGATFADIRDFIVRELESGGGNRHPSDPLFYSLADVKVSKPIVPWRDPAQPAKKPLKVVKFPSKG